MRRNPNYRNSVLKHEISNVSGTPFFVVTSAPQTPRITPRAIITTFIKNSTQHIEIPTTPIGACARCRPTKPHYFVAPLLLPPPSNLPFLLSPLFLDYRVTIAVTSPERSMPGHTVLVASASREGGAHLILPCLFSFPRPLTGFFPFPSPFPDYRCHGSTVSRPMSVASEVKGRLCRHGRGGGCGRGPRVCNSAAVWLFNTPCASSPPLAF